MTHCNAVFDYLDCRHFEPLTNVSLPIRCLPPLSVPVAAAIPTESLAQRVQARRRFAPQGAIATATGSAMQRWWMPAVGAAQRRCPPAPPSTSAAVAAQVIAVGHVPERVPEHGPEHVPEHVPEHGPKQLRTLPSVSIIPDLSPSPLMP